MASSSPLNLCKNFLDGYNPVPWPDLPAHRFPSTQVYSTQKIIPSANPAIIVAAAARVLSAYIGTADLLLSVDQILGEGPTFVRASWSQDLTWSEFAHGISQDVITNAKFASLLNVRRVLDLSEKQAPSIVQCSFVDEPSLTSYPLLIWSDSGKSQITLFTTYAHTHPSVADQLLSQIMVLIQHILVSPESLVRQIPQLHPSLISVHNRVPEHELANVYRHLPVVPFVCDYLTSHARTFPDQVAVQWCPSLTNQATEDPLDTITYQDLELQSNRFARWLNSLGIEPEDTVAICHTRNLDFHIAMIGVLKAGGCYVPIDPDLPDERKRYIAHDCDAKLVLTSSDLSPLPLFGEQTVHLDSEENRISISQQLETHVSHAIPDNLAFLLYTSGTTGQPKGCLLTHRGLSQAILALSDVAADVGLEDSSKGRYLVLASVAFDVHLAETFVPIALGIPILSAQRSQLLENLPFYVKKFAVTHIGIVPSLIEATMGAIQSGDEKEMALRYIASGGEKMSDLILDKWANHPQIRLVNFYGPSEATIGCCSRRMNSTTPKTNIGQPLANVSGYVVDRDMNILPRGGLGELVVEGPMVGRGYRGRPDLTQKVFLQWPNAGNWAYRTGDLVRMMPDGTLEIMGRIDTQIKLRGVRIESEGISALVRKGVSVSPTAFLDAVTVLARHPQIGVDQLVSFVTWDPSPPISVRKVTKPYIVAPPLNLLQTIREICRIELASYMRPSHIIPISWLPLNSNGKSDDKVLVSLFRGLKVETLAQILTEKTTNDETRVATKLEQDIFSVLLRHSNFPLEIFGHNLSIFECGMDSLAIIQFIADLKSTLGLRLSASDIMQSPTISAIASLSERSLPPIANSTPLVDAFASKLRADVVAEYQNRRIGACLPPFTVQEGILARSVHQSNLYVQHVVLRLKNEEAIARIKKAWRMASEIFPILRTIFHFGRELAQIVLPNETFVIPWNEEVVIDAQDFASWFTISRADAIAKSINEGLSDIPPWRISLFRAQESVFLVLSIHHALFDGTSLPILINGVELASKGLDLQPQANGVQILEKLLSARSDHSRPFWMSCFANFKWPNPPHTPALSSNAKTNAKIGKVRLKTKLSSIRALASTHNVTIQSLFVAAFASILSTRVQHVPDVCFGVIRSGRLLPVECLDTTAFPLLTLVPFRVNLTKTTRIQDIQTDISTMVQYEHTPLSKVQNWIRPGRPLFDVVFSVSVQDHSTSDLWDVISSELLNADYPFAAEVVTDMAQDQLIFQISWLEAGIGESVAHLLLEEFEQFLLAIGKTGLISVNPRETKSLMWENPLAPVIPTSESDAVRDADRELLTKLRAIVSSFLRVNTEALTENISLISMGLDSIKSVGLAKTLKKEGFAVLAVDLMNNSSLGALTNFVVRSRKSPKEIVHDSTYQNLVTKLRSQVDISRLKLKAEDAPLIYPTTSLQAGLLAQTIGSEGRLYTHAFPVQLASSTDVDRLRDAWSRARDVFAILRTTFHFVTDLGTWVQCIHTKTPAFLFETTITSEGDYQQALKGHITATRFSDETSFANPPFCVHLYRSTSPTISSHLCVILHHSLYDGLSIGKLFGSVSDFYRGDPHPQPVQFVDILEEMLQQELSGTAYWVQQLEGYRPKPPLRLPPTLGESAPVIAVRQIIVDSTTLENTLKTLAVTTQCLGQAAWAIILASLHHSSDIVFGHTVSGRTIVNSEDVIGPVLNTIPFRIQLNQDATGAQLLRSIHLQNVSSLPWRHASLRSILREFQVSQLWDSLFLFQPAEDSSSPGETLWSWNSINGVELGIQYALNANLRQTDSGFILDVGAHSTYVSVDKLAGLLDQFTRVLSGLILQPELPISHYFDFSPCTASANHSEGDLGANHGRTHEVSESLFGDIKNIISTTFNVPVAGITPTTPLVALGLDSIGAIQFAARCRDIGIELKASDIIQCQVVKDIAERALARSLDQGNLAQLVEQIPSHEIREIKAKFGSTAEGIQSILPLAPNHKYMVGAWQAEKGARFAGSWVYKLRDMKVLDDLRAAWKVFVERHRMLRATFATATPISEPRLVIFSPEYYDYWAEVECKCIDEYVIRGKLLELATAPITTRVPMTRGVLMYSDNDAYFIIRLHHVSYDAWSYHILMDDLSRLCTNMPLVASNDLLSFLGATRADQERLEKQREYWQSALPPGCLPSWFPSISPIPRADPPKWTVVTLPTVISHASLRENRARELGIPLPMVLLACWAKIQAEYSSSESAVFGLWQAGRIGIVDGCERLALSCVNVLPVASPNARHLDGLEVAKQMQADLRVRSGLLEHTDLIKIHQWVNMEGRPLTNVYINFIKVAPPVPNEMVFWDFVDIPFEVADPPQAELDPCVDRLPVADVLVTDLLIEFAVMPDTDTILMAVICPAYVLDRDQAVRLIDRWATEVQSILSF